MSRTALVARALDGREVRCPGCLENLCNLQDDRCPECSTRVELALGSTEAVEIRSLLRRIRRWALICGPVAAGLIMVAWFTPLTRLGCYGALGVVAAFAARALWWEWRSVKHVTVGDPDLLDDFLEEHHPKCPRCSYDLSRSAGRRCPECDAPFELRIAFGPPGNPWS